MDDTEGFGCLGHSNWTICSLLSHICSPNFPTFSLSYWRRPILITPERGRLKMGKGGKGNSPKMDETGVLVPRAFKLDHLQPVKPILFPKFSNFYIIILGSPILITPVRGRLKMGKWSSPNPWHSNWIISSLLCRFC